MTRPLTPASPVGGNRGRQALTHYIPPSELYPPHLGRKALCGAEPASGWSASTVFTWAKDQENLCQKCVARVTDGDVVDEPGAQPGTT
jgi:hypothetical protein